MKKMNMLWTKIAAIALGAILTVGVGATLSSFSSSREAEAATVETKRVWMKNSITSTWDADGAGTAIHYWGGAQGTDWPGVRVNWDAANSLVYFDLPADVTTYMFVRVNGSGTIADWGAKTEDLVYEESVGKYFDLTGPIAWGGATTPGSFVSFTPSTTTIVDNFVATIDTAAEACSAGAVNTAIAAYNALSTFEQDQFDVLSFGSPAKTGLETLNYLKSFYGISTPLNANVLGTSTDRNIAIIVTVGALSLTALAGFYFLSRKRKANQF